MPIDAISAATQTSTASAAEKAKGPQLDYNAFLKLLIAQLENQDPMEPMKSSDYVAQLATFSQVEQSIATNQSLKSLLTSSQLTLAEGLIGRTIVSADGVTIGKVQSARITADGVVAVLTNGTEVKVEPGVTIKGDKT
jgi:flagellar basal-body rod modification protein FlgD